MVQDLLTPEQFTHDDLADLGNLQPPDWRDITPRFKEFIRSPQCSPIKLRINKKTVAIGTSIKHQDTAWLACIIVHRDFRNRGLGRQITAELMRALDPKQFKTIYLEATELGFPVYQKLGFQVECEYSHFLQKTPPFSQNSHTEIIDFKPEFQADILHLDKEVSGENRSALLSGHLNGSKLYFKNNELLGFYLPSLLEGPILAKNTDAGLALMAYRANEKTTAAFPTPNEAALAEMPKLGFEFLRRSRRMFYGEKRIWHPHNLFNRISGQLG